MRLQHGASDETIHAIAVLEIAFTGARADAYIADVKSGINADSHLKSALILASYLRECRARYM